jgi:hypothetical protein
VAVGGEDMAKALIVCAWCKKVKGVKETDEPIEGSITHGICPECSDKMLKKAQEETNEDRAVPEAGR